MYEIEKNIPVPASLTRGRPARYPWSGMEIGDSFFVSGKSVRSFESCVRQASMRTGRTFRPRDVEGGVRVWRIA